jgi:tetratricopeptide (TPR) repeat protein
MDTKPTTHWDEASHQADISFLSAASLAAAGRLQDAQALLCPDGQLPTAPASLDLLARIAAQCGDLDRARELWQAALEADPKYAPARQALDSLASPWFAVAATKRIAALVLATLTFCLALVGLQALFHQLLQPTPQAQLSAAPRIVRVPSPTSALEPAAPPVPAASPSATEAIEGIKNLAQAFEHRAGQLEAQLQTLQQKQGESLATNAKLSQFVDSLAASNHVLLSRQEAALALAHQTQHELRTLADAYARDHRSPTNATPTPPSLPSLNLSLDDIAVERYAGGWEVHFKSALFDRDDHLKIGAKSQLESVGKGIVRSQQKVFIQVVGFADNEPPTWPWSEPLTDAQLGQLRADRVKQTLARLSLFPATALSATNGAGGQLPCPGGGRENRTVILRISPRP